MSQKIGRWMERAAQRDYSKSWQIPGKFPWIFQQPKPPITGRPISVKENYLRCVKGDKPYWMPAYFYEVNIVWPDALEEHPIPEVDGYDWWGVDWILVDDIDGMITRPGTRVISEFSKWKEEVEWPDLSLVDFATDGAKIQKAYDPDRPHVYECVEGITERLHEMMPFDECLMAFYEEPELLREFHEKMADYKIECCKQVFTHYGRVDGVVYHDDWGTQRSGFYSNEMFREHIMPPTQRLLDYMISQGMFLELHSCGNNMQYVPEIIEMGFDMWTPQIDANDIEALYDNYGKDLSFSFMLFLKKEWDEEKVRETVRAFVDRFGATGRTMCWIRPEDIGEVGMKQDDIARDELYRYSLNYYNQLYGRK
ncbi:MAG: methyltransferase [Eubacteriaceae bacterium]|nr:methyltransferase [Eubacteriaceae bacterium]